MTERIAEVSPRSRARIAGLLYLIVFATGGFAELYVRSTLIVSDNASATAGNILAHEPLFRLGFAADLVGAACYIAVTLILYGLFKPVSRSISLLAAFFSLAGCAILAINLLNYLAPLYFLGNAHYLSALKTDQLQALAFVSLRLHALGYNIAMVFFGLYCLLIGILIVKSTFLPRLLGLLLAIAGLSDLIKSFAIFVSPAFADHLFPYILAPGAIGELSLCLWLLAVGVNGQKWEQQAGAAGERA